MACRDGVVVTAQAILLCRRGAEATWMTNWISGKFFTFWFSALDPEDRLRYPPVSLFFGMYSWSQTRRGVQENLFDTRFAAAKVGVHGRLLVVLCWCRLVVIVWRVLCFWHIRGFPNCSWRHVWLSIGLVSATCVAYMACRDGVVVTVQAILFGRRGVEAMRMTNRISGKKITFWFPARDPDNRLRYPLVSLFFVMCLWSGMARLV